MLAFLFIVSCSYLVCGGRSSPINACVPPQGDPSPRIWLLLDYPSSIKTLTIAQVKLLLDNILNKGDRLHQLPDDSDIAWKEIEWSIRTFARDEDRNGSPRSQEQSKNEKDKQEELDYSSDSEHFNGDKSESNSNSPNEQLDSTIDKAKKNQRKKRQNSYSSNRQSGDKEVEDEMVLFTIFPNNLTIVEVVLVQMFYDFRIVDVQVINSLARGIAAFVENALDILGKDPNYRVSVLPNRAASSFHQLRTCVPPLSAIRPATTNSSSSLSPTPSSIPTQ